MTKWGSIVPLCVGLLAISAFPDVRAEDNDEGALVRADKCAQYSCDTCLDVDGCDWCKAKLKYDEFLIPHLGVCMPKGKCKDAKLGTLKDLYTLNLNSILTVGQDVDIELDYGFTTVSDASHSDCTKDVLDENYSKYLDCKNCTSNSQKWCQMRIKAPLGIVKSEGGLCVRNDKLACFPFQTKKKHTLELTADPIITSTAKCSAATTNAPTAPIAALACILPAILGFVTTASL